MSKEETVFYTTHDGTRDGRASVCFATSTAAHEKRDEQNARAESLGIKARYEVKSMPIADVPENESIRKK